MTAIVRTFTPDGFVIAADGREANPADRSVITDESQKIFPIRSKDGEFALSLCGVRKIADDQRTEILFDLQEEALAACEAFRLVRNKSADDYITKIAHRIFSSLLNIAESRGQSKFPDFPAAYGERGKTISRVHLDGYFEGLPARVEFRLWHENQRLREPEVRHQVLTPGFHITYGSGKIGRLLHSGNLLFSKYRWPKILSKDVSVQDAIHRSQCYIEACSDPEALSVDQDCFSIGGRIHMATITPKEGFEWVPGYEPLSSG